MVIGGEVNICQFVSGSHFVKDEESLSFMDVLAGTYLWD